MNNVKKNRTGLRLLGSVRGGNYRRFTMNKTQQNQPVYKNIEPRCPGAKGNKPGCRSCPGSNTNVGCKTCWGCTYTFDVSSTAFRGAYPSYGSFANVNLLVDNSNNPPCEWQYNAIVEGFSFDSTDLSNTRVTINIEDNKCLSSVQDICGVYFYEPVGGNSGTYVGQFKNCDTTTGHITGHEMGVPHLHKFVTTAKRMGAPYRNPIAGWRKTLDCCEEPCKVILFEGGNHLAPTIGTLIGYPYSSSTKHCTGTVTDYTTNGTTLNQGYVTSITVQLDDCCCIPAIGELGPVNGVEYGPITNIVMITRETSGAAQQPTNTVYKDNYSGPKSNCYPDLSGCGCCPKDCSNTKIVHRSGIQGRTHRPIIRSGMQEKRPCCRDSNGKCNKTNDYSFSYWQYKHNKRCLDYERNQEKYVRNFPACGIFHGRMQCLNAYRKSSCCDCTCEPCFQVLQNTANNLPTITVGSLVTQDITGASGTITHITYIGNTVNLVTVQNNGCQSQFDGAYNFILPSYPPGPYVWTDVNVVFTSGAFTKNCTNSKAMAKTIYKPSNKKFSHQGAVTSGGRLERLKLDTIKSANSKCIKGQKCITIPSKFVGLNKTYKYPNGKYGAGKPRFTGWMFNGHHSEVKGRVYNMVRYNQQPLGIPQLTAHRLTLSQGGNGCGPKQCFPRTLNLGSTRPTAAGNRARIPGAKCPDGSVNPCNKCGDNSIAPCNNIPNQTGQGLRCC